MKTDTTTKILLGLIAAGLWLRPAFAPVPATAQGVRSDVSAGPAVVGGERGLYVIENGRIYRFVETLGKPVSIGEYGPGVTAR